MRFLRRVWKRVYKVVVMPDEVMGVRRESGTPAVPAEGAVGMAQGDAATGRVK